MTHHEQLTPTAEERAAAHGNRDVGTRLLFENDAVRVWEVRLASGERAPLHCHALDYFWTCVDAGTAGQITMNGSDWQRTRVDYAVGDTRFFPHGQGTRTIHDLHNIGDTTLRFITVELLGTAHQGTDGPL
ncbi:cupin domain-containing protein [Streptomyces cucumeris]|uniref:cupin domain-containing protein n=1 Tax=Streptomyces cucumeris TaxID=2962890 RepID=UPI003D73A485